MDFKCDELILGKKDADSRALTVLFHLQIEGGVHVHGHSFNLLASFSHQLEKRANSLSAVAM